MIIYFAVVTWFSIGLLTSWAVSHYWKTVYGNEGPAVLPPSAYLFIIPMTGPIAAVLMGRLLYRWRDTYREARRDGPLL